MLSRAQEIVLEALRVPNSIDLAPPSRAPASVANLKSFLRLLSYDRVVLYCRALSRLFCLSAASSARHLAIQKSWREARSSSLQPVYQAPASAEMRELEKTGICNARARPLALHLLRCITRMFDFESPL